MGIRLPHYSVRAAFIAVLLLITGCASAVAPTPSATFTPAPTATMRPVTTSAAHETPLFPVSAVEYPANYRTDFLHYVTIDRPDAVVRDLYINSEAVAELRRTRRLPDDAIIVVEAWDAQVDANGDPLTDAAGHYLKDTPQAMVHVGHKRSDWGDSDFPGAARSGNWNFGSFDFETGAPFNEDLGACFNCHQAANNRDFVYSAAQLVDYAASDVRGYFFCELRRRTPCS